VYVERAVRDTFLEHLVDHVRRIRPGSDDEATYGPMTMPAQLRVVRRHVDEALASGGTAVFGGPESIGDRFAGPVVILDPPHDSAAVAEETFGPTLTVTTVSSVDEAVQLANDSAYGLAGAVFSRTHGDAIASRLDTCQVSVNSVLGFAGMASLPLGGRGESGFGRIHGPEGLREFSRTRAVATQRRGAPVNLSTLSRKRWVLKLLPRLIPWLHRR